MKKKIEIDEKNIERTPENELNFIVQYFCNYVNRKMGEVVVKPKL